MLSWELDLSFVVNISQKKDKKIWNFFFYKVSTKTYNWWFRCFPKKCQKWVYSGPFLRAFKAKNTIVEVENQKFQSLKLNLRPKKAKLDQKWGQNSFLKICIFYQRSSTRFNRFLAGPWLFVYICILASIKR